MVRGNAVGLYIPPRNVLTKPPERNTTQIKSTYLSIFIIYLKSRKSIERQVESYHAVYIYLFTYIYIHTATTPFKLMLTLFYRKKE